MSNLRKLDDSALLGLIEDMVEDSPDFIFELSTLADALFEDLWFLAGKRHDYDLLGDILVDEQWALRHHLESENAAEFTDLLESLIWRSIPAEFRSDAEFGAKVDGLFEDIRLNFRVSDYFSLTGTLQMLIWFCLEAKATSRSQPIVISDSTVTIGRHTSISFVRTLRIPEDGKTYPLPAGFGRLPIYRVADYANKVPAKWLEDGGFFIPLYQREALYLEFGGADWRPTILKVAVGRVNAVTGKPFDEQIRRFSQDYVVIPDQQWLDGINKGNGVVGQFVAMPLGKGYTVEEQVTDEAKHGGFQLMAYDSKTGRFPDEDPAIRRKKDADYLKRHPKPIELPKLPPLSPPVEETTLKEESHGLFSAPAAPQPSGLKEVGSEESSGSQILYSPRKQGASAGWALSSPVKQARALPQVVEMGIAAGGAIEQKIVVDKYGAESWDENTATSICIHIVNSEVFEAITGQKPPETPISAYSYKKRGIPWFSNYDESVPGLAGAKAFQFIKSVFQIDRKRGIDKQSSVPGLEVPQEQIRRIQVPTIPERVASLRESARASFDKESYESCIRESTWLLDLSPNDAFALLMRANSYIRLGQYDLADMDATAVLQRDPRHIDAYLVRAYANLSSGWWIQAAKDAGAVLGLSPTNQRAKDLFNRALKSTPK
ncbi:MAG TPA: hypothetical protein DDZ88_23455 [Verrucomicrobiales bacterium]|nr:hypothetical protein [Verrucomicrobiales bacterium]